MPIRDFPFRGTGGFLRPWLPIRIINPHTGLFFDTRGLVDTGADECCVPDFIAHTIGHNVEKGTPADVGGIGGKVDAYKHTTKIEIYDYSDKLVYTINEACIDCIVGGKTVLLGTKEFLDKFMLAIDYPAKKFSITFPAQP